MEKQEPEVECSACGWKGKEGDLLLREGEREVVDGFFIWFDMRHNRRVDRLCPRCRGRIRSDFDLYGYEGTVFSDDYAGCDIFIF